eukprot:CAMPEP_0194297288 /NCGR_PEP_ID=MMETSP0169-20130528/58497_1 /TAXON_ID=218684 /ORGANISM="Corethron pennatum, Strain L29A3" /LENGTH=103 /DNA_ID=CAMNT_0039047041 /DNA_START=149 /DNA_END=457 /DNA_ORIENTATION=+
MIVLNRSSNRKRRKIISEESATSTSKLTESPEIQFRYGLSIKVYGTNTTKRIDRVFPRSPPNAIDDDNDILHVTDEKNMSNHPETSDDENDTDISYLTDSEDD